LTVTRVVLVTAALAAAVAVLAVLARPPARLELAGAPDGTIAGGFHIHTNRSDGRGSPDDVARAAARAGLAFVVFTDHGDGTRAPDPPTYRAGVLCLDGVELSTSGGHYIAIDMPAAPYPLGGEARDVIDDVRRLGGFGIVAHPDSPKGELAWKDWTLPFDGVELVNLDTGWRKRVGTPRWSTPLVIARALAGYPLRPAETLGELLASTHADPGPYDSVSNRRPVVALAGADVHAKLALFDGEPGDNRFSLPFPGYASVFRAFSLRVRPDRPLSGDAAADGALVVAAIRRGQIYTVADGLASPPSFEFSAEHDGRVARIGERIEGGPVVLRVKSNAPPAFTTLIRSAGKAVAAGNGAELSARVEGPGVFRAEVRAPHASGEALWILSNPIYVGKESAQAVEGGERVASQPPRFLYEGGDGSNWNVEADPMSQAAKEIRRMPDAMLTLSYRLADGPPAGQFAALAQGTPGGIAPYDRISFDAQAEQPMRISLQLRVENAPGRADRWRRSIYLDRTTRSYTVAFEEMSPIKEVEEPFRASHVHSVMFVVELTNTKPGSAGTLSIGDIRLER
jgi:hypothetical protein